MLQSGECYFGDGIHEDIYEKWLRRRLDYAVIRETGSHAAPGFVHTMLHSGKSHVAVASELREEMWKNNKYPNSSFFQHGQVLYRYPPYVQEILDLRFFNSPGLKERCSLSSAQRTNVYDLSLREIVTVPDWRGPIIINTCPYPHTLETPLTWTLGEKPGPTGIRPCRDPSRINTPAYPGCCYRQENICSAVYCKNPLPETVYIPGPTGRSMAHFKWHLNHPEGKRSKTLTSERETPKETERKHVKCPNPCLISSDPQRSKTLKKNYDKC